MPNPRSKKRNQSKMSEDSPQDMSEKLEMRFDLNVLKHLGLKMYTSLPAVISEYVANSWDAWAETVDISIPQNESMSPEYKITIRDDGRGMSRQEVNDEFLVIGRNRRQDEGKDAIRKGNSTRKIMGRKGIGKLAGFGVADIVKVHTRKDGEYIEFELDYGKMREKAKEDPNATTTYNPKIIGEGETNQESGTIITLTNFDREQRPREKYVRQRLARRFSVVGNNFEVRVNGEAVSGTERNLKQRCQFRRDYDKEVINDDKELTISGWIGTLTTPVPDDVQGGVAVMARGKTVQEPITFGVAEGGTRGQMALQYLVGEIHADFLDGEEDLIATHRTAVLWEKEPADELRDFLESEIEKICSEWPEKRKIEEMEEIKEEEPYEKFIAPLDEREKKLADEFLGDMVRQGDYDDESIEELASYVSSGVQQKSFRDLLREIERSEISNTEQLVKLFDQYEILDAMNSLRIVRGRYYAIQKFENLVEKEGSGINDLHGFVSDNPWLIDPRWDYLDEEIEVREKLVNNFIDADEGSRVGFISLGDADTLRLVDVRKPSHVVMMEDLDQFKSYVDYLRATSDMKPVDNRDVEGYIIAKGVVDDREVESEIRRMKMDEMRIRTYDDIKDIARRSHREFLQIFERKAKRTESEMLKTYLEGSGQAGLHEFVSGNF